jgi:hypothetical protein
MNPPLVIRPPILLATQRLISLIPAFTSTPHPLPGGHGQLYNSKRAKQRRVQEETKDTPILPLQDVLLPRSCQPETEL